MNSNEFGLSISFSGEASEAFADWIDADRRGWGVRITPLEGEPFDASLIGSGRDERDEDGNAWFDAVVYLPIDADGVPIEGASLQTVRVKDVFVY